MTNHFSNLKSQLELNELDKSIIETTSISKKIEACLQSTFFG